ncbi:glycosyltransferase [candidate division KSB1 bacterium]
MDILIKRPLIFTGLNSNYTSFIAKLVNQKGAQFGPKTHETNDFNHLHFYEDLDIIDFHHKILKELHSVDQLQPDQHLTLNKKLEKSFLESAMDLAEQKNIIQNWVWKNQLASFFPEFWKKIFPNALFIFIIQDLVFTRDSLQMLKKHYSIFSKLSDEKLWELYHRNIQEYCDQNTNDSLVVQADRVIQSPELFIDLLTNEYGFDSNSELVTSFNIHPGNRFNTAGDFSEFRDLLEKGKENTLFNSLNRNAVFSTQIDIPILDNKSSVPLISLVIPCYNHGRYIKDTIKSVLMLHRGLYEVIIVDDGSDDPETIKILNNIIDPDIQLIRQKNMGLAEARNAGIKKARSKYILTLDSDNTIDPAYVYQAIDILDRNKEVGVVYANHRFFGSSNGYKEVENFSLQRLLIGNYIDACAIFRKKVWENNQGFDPDMPVQGYEDWNFWIGASNNGWMFHHLPDYLFDYRTREDSMIKQSFDPENRFKMVEYTVQKYKKLYNKYFPHIISSLHKIIANWEGSYESALINLNNKLNNQQSQYDNLLKLLHNYENRIKEFEDSIYWKLKQHYNKLKYLLRTSSNIGKRKGLKFIRRFVFLISRSGRTILRRFASKILKSLYLIFEERHVRIIYVHDEHAILSEDPYTIWRIKYAPREMDFIEFAEQITYFKYQPKISIIVPVYNPPIHLLRASLNSVIDQIYENWELCIADDNSSDPEVKKVLQEYERSDHRIKLILRKENGHISQCSNTALSLAEGEFTALLDHDDLLSKDALFQVVKLLNKYPDTDLIYSDEDKIDENDRHFIPHFKPQWCPDNLLSRNYFGHLTVLRLNKIGEIGGFRIGFEGSQDYDLFLRYTEKTDKIKHIPKVLYHWRVHKKSAALSEEVKPYAYNAARNALIEALERRNEKGSVDFLPGFRGYSIRYNTFNPGKVSVIIPSKDKADILDVCLKSLFEKTSYTDYEVILINNRSSESSFDKLVEKWKQLKAGQFKCIDADFEFNFSKIINYGVQHATGTYLLFLNNDTEIIHADWMEAMVEQAQRKSIGAVGVKLLYQNNTIQHAGVIIGLGGAAGHTFVGIHKDAPGYFNYIQSINNYAAVTAACMMCRRVVFDEVGGFDEGFTVEYNDVDFCLKLLEHNYNNVYLPHVSLYHYESLSRGHPHMVKSSFEKHKVELKKFQDKWNKYIIDDPCYNQNLSLGAHDFQIKT